jgi:hypothetical protein
MHILQGEKIRAARIFARLNFFTPRKFFKVEKNLRRAIFFVW